MPIKTIINCVIISVLLSAISPCFFLQTFAPAEGEKVFDLTTIDKNKLSEMSPEEAKEYFNKDVKLKQVTGLDRFTYMFTDPSVGIMYLRTALWMLLPILISSLISSYLNMRLMCNRLILKEKV